VSHSVGPVAARYYFELVQWDAALVRFPVGSVWNRYQSSIRKLGYSKSIPGKDNHKRLGERHARHTLYLNWLDDRSLLFCADKRM
jgi:hypothetical protein